jgi:hypothetical protein
MAKDTHDYSSAYTPLGLAQVIASMRFGDLKDAAAALYSLMDGMPDTPLEFATLIHQWAEETIQEASREEED